MDQGRTWTNSKKTSTLLLLPMPSSVLLSTEQKFGGERRQPRARRYGARLKDL